MGNDGFYGCLSNLTMFLRVSAWRKETAQTRVFVLSRSSLLSHLEPQSNKAKILLPIMPVWKMAPRLALLREGPSTALLAAMQERFPKLPGNMANALSEAPKSAKADLEIS